jgi:glycosyltransferase involved in cell wall biosynthesis
MPGTEPSIAVMIPCLNEEVTVGKVVRDFTRELPGCNVFVYDNGSTDQTFMRAREAGAIVRRESLRGKGNVVRQMFADIEADVFIMVDGDGTYDPGAARALVNKLLSESLDVVSGSRVETSAQAYRLGHRFGNQLLSSVVAYLFGRAFKDMLSGYRVMSRRFVKSFPALSSGFEIDTELTIHALQLRLPIAEVETMYGSRPESSTSKLNTYRDGIRILMTIAHLVKEEKPLEFFTTIAFILAASSLILGYPIVVEFFRTGLVPRLPTAVLATGLMLSALVNLFSGIILQTVTRGRVELKRLYYLSVPILPPNRARFGAHDRDHRTISSSNAPL